MGKGQGPRSLLTTWHSGEPCQVSSDPLTFCHLSGDVSGEPLFEGFPLAGEGFDLEITNRRNSVLQAARRRCLAQSSGSSLLSLPSRSGMRLRMRSLQLELWHWWDFVDESVAVPWTPEIELDLLWWYDTDHLLQGVSLEVQHQDPLFRSDASDQGWGAHLHYQFVSSRWTPEERSLSINLRELWAIRLGLLHFGQSLQGKTVRVFTDNTTALSYVKRQGGTFSMALNQEAQLLLC